ncbi:uncharacterized protein LOC129002770 isoform X2 [Macrosteles quadrilineatus]|uniref:uncharacterized protein LOC129002770 isoform X2 n=1 Tax=Macrosteles quadrilineatus TaxID=74068 RepID=UPI0023E261D1|nr:uncharacterized protein LOC129002770 isoform X2 [Macrosteles quadrilineatus]
MGGLKHLALLVIVLFVGPCLTAPTPDPEPEPLADPEPFFFPFQYDSEGCSNCYYKGNAGFLYALVQIIELVLALVLSIVFLVLNLLGGLLGPISDASTLLGALTGTNALETFLGSLPIVLKFLNIINVPTALLG